MKISAPSGVDVSVSVDERRATRPSRRRYPASLQSRCPVRAARCVVVVALPGRRRVRCRWSCVALPVVALPALPCSTVDHRSRYRCRAAPAARPALPLPAPSVFLPPFDSTTATPAIAAPTTSTPAIMNAGLAGAAPRPGRSRPSSVVGAGVTTPLGRDRARRRRVHARESASAAPASTRAGGSGAVDGVSCAARTLDRRRAPRRSRPDRPSRG